MKKLILASVVGILASFLVLGTFGVYSWSADKYELRYASEYPDKHPTVRNAILPHSSCLTSSSNDSMSLPI